MLPFVSMKVYGGVGDLESSASTAQHLESVGYDGVWAGEINNDPFLSLTVAANATRTLELGTSIAVAFARSPMTLAYTANDLQRFSGGRLTVGLGSQVKAHVTRRFSMPWSQPAARMREYARALHAIWGSWSDGTKLSFEGDFYSLTLMPPTFVPTPHPFGPPKVLVAGVGEAMTRVAGEVADGFICHFFTTERWIRERTIPALKEGSLRVGRTLYDFDVVAGVFIVTGTEQDIVDGLAAFKAQIAFYASTPSYRPVLELHGWGALGDELTALSKQNRWSDMAALIGDDVVDAFAVVAPPGDVAERIERRFGGLVTHLSFLAPASLSEPEVQATVATLRGSRHEHEFARG
jgi:probable F420-dependent oxidoreductase